SALSFRVGLPGSEYPSQPRITAAHQAILDRLAVLPGATRVAASTCMPVTEEGNRFTSMTRVFGRVLPAGALSPATGFCAVSGGYFEALGTSVIRGRGIDRDDVDRQHPVAVVNQAWASAYFGADDPVGQRVTIGPPRNTLWLTVVGVVRNTPVRALAEP